MMNASDFESIVAACYQSAVDVSKWPEALDLIGQQFRGTGAGIVFYNEKRNPHTIHSHSLLDAHQPYRDHWWKHDTRIAKAKRLNFKNGDVASDFHLIRPEEKLQDPFFQEFGRDYGFDELMGYFAQDPFGGTMTISIPRGASEGPFQRDELAALKLIGGHVARAFTLTAKLQALSHRILDLEQSLEQSSVGVIVLKHDNTVYNLNTVAENLIADCFSVSRNGKLVVLNQSEKIKFDEMIKSLSGSVSTYVKPSAVIKSIYGDLRLFVEAVKVNISEHTITTFNERHTNIILLLRDFSAGTRPSIAPHLEQMGLTKAEARVAIFIGRGLSPLQTAQKLLVSPNTIKVQLKSIYSKLYISRQSELAGIVSRLDILIGDK